jgi:hypothetical protein
VARTIRAVTESRCIRLELPPVGICTPESEMDGQACYGFSIAVVHTMHPGSPFPPQDRDKSKEQSIQNDCPVSVHMMALVT